MSQIIVKGGSTLSGSIAVQGAKNSALPILAATILNRGETVLRGCPRLRDVDASIRILRHLGCQARWEGDALVVNTAGLNRSDISDTLMREMRSSAIFLGAILARCGQADLSYPGGCELGPRPIDLHLTGLRDMGAVIREDSGRLCCTAPRLVGRELILSLPSVGATENLMTFYDPVTNTFGALGHGITDVDTAALMPFSSGSILPSTVKTVKRGETGAAGELKGNFDLTGDTGSLYANTSGGVFGTLTDQELIERLSENALPVAENDQVHTGKATILANVDGDTVKEYGIEITKILNTDPAGRNLLLTVTDPELLEKTGGIVQGMSGSPILQDGRLVGAVTHGP